MTASAEPLRFDELSVDDRLGELTSDYRQAVQLRHMVGAGLAAVALLGIAVSAWMFARATEDGLAGKQLRQCRARLITKSVSSPMHAPTVANLQ